MVKREYIQTRFDYHLQFSLARWWTAINLFSLDQQRSPVNIINLPLEDHVEKPWYIYIVECRDKSLYTGITTDLSRRIGEHNSTRKGAKYTRPRRPVTLAYYETVVSRAVATSREHQIKKMTTAAKHALIQKQDKISKPLHG